MNIPDNIKRDAGRAFDAGKTGDWALANHIKGRYRPDSPERVQFEWILRELEKEFYRLYPDKQGAKPPSQK